MTGRRWINLVGEETNMWTVLVPAIVAAYLVGSIPFGVIIARAHGKDLRAILTKARELGQSLGLEYGLFIASRVCAGLEYAHTLKDFHRYPRQKRRGGLILESMRHRVGPDHRECSSKAGPKHPRRRIRPRIAHRSRCRHDALAKFGRQLVGPVKSVRNGRMRHAHSFGDILQGAASPQRRFHLSRR